MRRYVTGTLRTIAVALLAAVVSGSVCAETTGPGPGLGIYVDGRLYWRADRDAMHGRASDYRRGALEGWRVFGALLPPSARANTALIEAVAKDGTRLRVEAPFERHPGFEPVLFLDRQRELRFMMVPSGQPKTFPHGRGPGDGRGGGGRRGASGPLALGNVTELHVNHRAPGSEDQGPAFELVVGKKSERLTVGTLRILVPAERVAGVDGEVWPLGALIAHKSRETPRAVTVEGAGGARFTATRAELEDGRRVYLRLNKRGLLKLEVRAASSARRLADVRDVSRIEVSVD